MSEKISLLDYKILNYMLEHDSQNLTKVAKDLNVPVPTLHNRIRYLKQSGVIKRIQPELDLDKLNLPVFAHIELEIENPMNVHELAKKFSSKSNITRIYRVVGNYDLLLAGYFSKPEEMNELVEEIAKDERITSVHGNIISYKYRDQTTPYPLKEP